MIPKAKTRYIKFEFVYLVYIQFKISITDPFMLQYNHYYVHVPSDFLVLIRTVKLHSGITVYENTPKQLSVIFHGCKKW